MKKQFLIIKMDAKATEQFFPKIQSSYLVCGASGSFKTTTISQLIYDWIDCGYTFSKIVIYYNVSA